RALIITAENDVLRDEGEAYNRKLIGAGAEVVTTRYNATTHDFVMLTGLTKLNPRTRRKVASRLAPAASIEDARVDGKYNRLREKLLLCL
ncbi:MAG TPA: alpha/beta hydrolase fold domain-containing protein, partial [Terriglobales bacterium]